MLIDRLNQRDQIDTTVDDRITGIAGVDMDAAALMFLVLPAQLGQYDIDQAHGSAVSRVSSLLTLLSLLCRATWPDNKFDG
ncbi:hypothetical protein XI09_13025 [Bradyrhizobium sp. CCBAU 11386]|nr:hypothetical protein [Bradyrhizobium sp. CCBAU 11386]